MEIQLITQKHALWDNVKEYARGCGWSSGKILADDMEKQRFSDWERIAVLLEGESLRGYCTIIREEAIPDMPYTPFIGTLYIDESCRGMRLGQQLLTASMDYLKSLGFEKAYLISDHENLYEKYGFRVIDKRMAPWGREEKVYVQEIGE